MASEDEVVQALRACESFQDRLYSAERVFSQYRSLLTSAARANANLWIDASQGHDRLNLTQEDVQELNERGFDRFKEHRMPKWEEAKQRLHQAIMADPPLAARELLAVYADEARSVDLRNLAATYFTKDIPEHIGQEACALALEDRDAVKVINVLRLIEQVPILRNSTVLQRVQRLAANESESKMRVIARRIAPAEDSQPSVHSKSPVLQAEQKAHEPLAKPTEKDLTKQLIQAARKCHTEKIKELIN